MKLTMVFAAALCGACSQGLGPVVPKTPVERQMIGLLEKFDRWDDNGDGELDAAEITAGLNAAPSTPYTADQVIAFYDTSGNKKISLSEAQAGYKRADDAEQHFQN